MCGICGSVSFSNAKDEIKTIHFKSSSFEKLKNNLQRRGPNKFKHISLQHREKIELFFCAAVLHLRGSSLAEQPVVDPNGNLLLWNGEIFGGSLMKTRTQSDSTILAKEMFSANNTSDILQVISSIEGPYAFIFYQKSGLLWFGRDIFGRRSLLWNFKDSTFQLCSVACGKTKWEEVPAVGIFCLDLNQTLVENKFVIHEYAWSSSATGNSLRREAEFFSGIDRTEVMHMLDFSVKIPISNALNRSVPSDGASSDFLNQLAELQSYKMSEQDLFKRLLDLPVLIDTVNEFEKFLSDAVKKRVENELGLCKLCYLSKPSDSSSVICDHASVGVLFSGGLDSIVIACLVDSHLVANKPIDLINVAFSSAVNEEGRRNQMHSKPFDTPDRITGKSGLKELEKISPSRKWNFVEVNISKEELIAKRQEFISPLLRPSCTVLDDSIGCALWFASQGKGSISASGEDQDYNSPTRVLLVGMGADEQLAGYSRHRVKFNDSGWSGLIEELSLELDRIGSRNLGRDDRIIADSGVESRYPFLDESVVSFLNGLPVWLKANLNFPRGIGEKLLLRLLAFKLGLTKAAGLPKRAIQFGSRIAKIENSKEKGFDVCERLKETSL